MYIPNPILFDLPPEGGSIISVTDERGWVAGYILLGLVGLTTYAEISADNGNTWQPLVYPHTLTPGEKLRFSRTDSDTELVGFRALAPVDEGPPPEPATTDFVVSSDPDGYLTSDDARISTDPDGYLSAPDELTQADTDGYLSEV